MNFVDNLNCSIFEELKDSQLMRQTPRYLTNKNLLLNDLICGGDRTMTTTSMDEELDCTRQWWATLVYMNEFRSQEITFHVKTITNHNKNKQQQEEKVLVIEAKKTHSQQPITMENEKAELHKVIQLPTEVDHERIRLIFTLEKVLIVKIPFILTDEQRERHAMRLVNNKQHQIDFVNGKFFQPMRAACFNTMNALNEKRVEQTCQLTDVNGWGPVLTKEMIEIQREIVQLVNVTSPHQVIPFFMKCHEKENKQEQHQIILDLVLLEMLRPEHIQITTTRDHKIQMNLKVQGQSLDGRVCTFCEAQKTFVVPNKVNLEKLQVKLMPNGHLRFIMPVSLTQTLKDEHRVNGEHLTVKH